MNYSIKIIPCQYGYIAYNNESVENAETLMNLAKLT